MTTAIILSGGTGTRMGSERPKQYIEVEGKPVLWYSLRIFEKHPLIDRFVVVAAVEWRDYVNDVIRKSGMKKFSGFADAGSSRQQSIYNGILKVRDSGADDHDIVIIHDAVRPFVSEKVLADCVNMLDGADGAVPVLPVRDTVYRSVDGSHISALLNRDELFAGQAPESFRFGKYLSAHENLSEEELSLIRGSSEIAFKAGMKIRMFSGDETNYKITTPDDLEKFRRQVREETMRL